MRFTGGLQLRMLKIVKPFSLSLYIFFNLKAVVVFKLVKKSWQISIPDPNIDILVADNSLIHICDKHRHTSPDPQVARITLLQSSITHSSLSSSQCHLCFIQSASELTAIATHTHTASQNPRLSCHTSLWKQYKHILDLTGYIYKFYLFVIVIMWIL